MKQSKSLIISISAVAALTAVSYFATKYQQKRISKHKEERLKGRNLNLEIANATFDNPDIEMDDRIKAAEVLQHLKMGLDNCFTVDSFDKQLQEIDDILDGFKPGTDKTADGFIARIRYYYSEIERRREEQKIAGERMAELDKIRTLGTAAGSVLGSIAPDININTYGGVLK